MSYFQLSNDKTLQIFHRLNYIELQGQVTIVAIATSQYVFFFEVQPTKFLAALK